MPFELKLPDIGEGIAEGEIVRWLVKPGERVDEGQPLVEVMTDKANVEIPAPRSGVIAALLAEAGQVVPVGTAIVAITVDGETAGAATGATADAASPGAQAADPRAAPGRAPTTAAANPNLTLPGAPGAPPPATARVAAAPAVRQLAKELRVSLERIAGSGPGGAVTAADVRRAAAAPGASAAAGAPGTAGSTYAPAGTAAEPEERVPVRGLRRLIAEHMKRSIQTAAHFTFVAECDFTALAEHRERTRARAESTGVRLTYLAYVLRALVAPLQQFPALNASLDDARGEIVLKRYYHIGLATHTDEGLTVPVLRHADRFGLFGLAREIERLAQAARAGKLKLEELQGGTFTVTSTGARGGVLATPILHHPQVAILGVHEIRKRPAVVGEAIVPRALGNLSLSLDHRVVDGQVGADFLYTLIAGLERPESWLNEGDFA